MAAFLARLRNPAGEALLLAAADGTAASGHKLGAS
jgi:hypothetical protein